MNCRDNHLLIPAHTNKLKRLISNKLMPKVSVARGLATKASRSRKSLSKPQAQAVKAIANKAISRHAEKKYHNDDNIASSISDTGYTWPLTDVPAGTLDYQRAGDSLYMRSIRVRGQAIVADTTNAVRNIVYQWFDDTTPTIADILHTTSGAASVFSPYVHDQRRKFRVLYDKTMILSANGNDAKLYDTGYLRPKAKKIAFSTGGTTGSNKIYLLQVSDSTVASHPAVTHYSRLTFNDM